MNTLYPPFDKADELYNAMSSLSQHVPGQPMISVSSDPDSLYKFLKIDLSTKDLDAMAPHLWLMSTRSHANVSPLHHQIVKSRRVVLTEDPGLHLTWIDDKIFIKPLPLYLLSHDFWIQHLLPQACIPVSTGPKQPSPAFIDFDESKCSLTASSLGFLRSYCFLIRYPSDFDIAINCRLLPPSTTFESFCAFATRFRNITDSEVRPRYHYGELRLSRLNFWSKFLLVRWHYIDIPHQYWQYFQRFYGPLLFLFGLFSVALSAMQVEMNVETLNANKWISFWGFSRVFSVLSLVLMAFTGLILLLLLSRKLLVELAYAVTHR